MAFDELLGAIKRELLIDAKDDRELAALDAKVDRPDEQTSRSLVGRFGPETIAVNVSAEENS